MMASHRCHMKPAILRPPYGVLDHLLLKRIADGRALLTRSPRFADPMTSAMFDGSWTGCVCVPSSYMPFQPDRFPSLTTCRTDARRAYTFNTSPHPTKVSPVLLP
ncbi:hypothetical protein HBI95_073880 [Parastagonospora nodorum]|nr:hypothetical protein HBI95_073880 [Parastagonospora nodorum]